MASGLRNSYAAALFAEWLESTQTMVLMVALVFVAAWVTWIFVRGLYGHKIVRLRYILLWMMLTELISMSILEALDTTLQQFDPFQASLIRVGLWIVIGWLVSLAPLINDSLYLSLRARIGYLVGVHITMRFLIFASLGAAFFYGLHYPKLLSKVTRVAPACREAITTVLQDL